MTTITKIGNSRGVRIPKAIIKQANLENTEIEFKIGNESLLLKPISNKPRIRQKPDFFYGKHYHKIKSRKHVHQSMSHRRIYQS